MSLTKRDLTLLLNLNHKRKNQIEREESSSPPETFSNRFKIIKEIEAYNPCLSLVTWSSIFNLLNIKEGDTRFNVVNFSHYGTGKSRSTLTLFRDFALPKTKVYSGHLTEKGSFLFLCKHIDYNIVIDETEIIDKKVKGLLKSALFDGNVSWITNNEDTNIDFLGSIIFNTNEIDKGVAGILDRTFFNKINLLKDDILKKTNSRLYYKPNKAIWKLVKDRIAYLRTFDSEIVDLTREEREGINSFINGVLSGLSANSPLSMRLNARVELIFKCIKNFFGGLSVDLWKFAEDISINYIRYSPMDNKDIFTDIVNSKRKWEEDKINEFIEKTGKSRKTYYNWKNKMS